MLMLRWHHVCRYVYKICIADYSDMIDIQGFDNSGVFLFGMTANELESLRVSRNQSFSYQLQLEAITLSR